MKAAEIQVGGKYIAKVSGKLTTVRVDGVRECGGFDRGRLIYDVTNLATGRKTTFRSAAKFRSEVKESDTLIRRPFLIPSNESVGPYCTKGEGRPCPIHANESECY